MIISGKQGWRISYINNKEIYNCILELKDNNLNKIPICKNITKAAS